MYRGRIKGSALREFLVWYEGQHDARTLRARIAELDEPARYGLDVDRPGLGLLASRWYPSEAAHLVLDLVTEGLSAEERTEFAREGSRAATAHAIRGVYQVVFSQLASPERYARHIQPLWRMLHDTGERRIELVDRETAVSTVRDWAGHHPFLCQLTVMTMCSVLEHMGCWDVDCAQTACVSWGDPLCRTTVTFHRARAAS